MNVLAFFSTWKVYLIAGAFVAATSAAGYYGYKAGALVVETKWDKQKVIDLTEQTRLSGQVIGLQQEALNKAAEQQVKDATAAAAAAEERERLALNAKLVTSKIDRLTRDIKASPQYQSCILDPQTIKELNGALAPKGSP